MPQYKLPFSIQLERKYNDINIDDFIKEFNAEKVPENFSYNSGKNTEWETVETLRKLIQEHVDSTFKV